MPNNQKIKLVDDIKSKVEKAKSIVLTNYHGLNAKQITTLRAQLKEKGADAAIAKNTLLKIAIKDNKLSSDEIEKSLKGPTLAIFSYDDAIAGVKTAFEFVKDNEALQIKAGIVDGNFTSTTKLEILSNLPSKEQLLAQVVGGLQAPITKFVGVLGGVQRKFVYAIAAIADAKNS